MEQFWRNTGVQLGKRWKIVAVVVGIITGVLALGAAKIEFAPELDTEDLAEAVNATEAAIRERVPQATHIYLEPDLRRSPEDLGSE